MQRRTTKPEYIAPIVEALHSLGSVDEDKLVEEAYKLIKDKLYPADFEVLPNGEPRWRNQMLNMLDGLIETGRVLKKDGLLSLSGS